MSRLLSRAQRKAAFLKAANRMYEDLEDWYDQHPEASFGTIEAEARRLRWQLMGTTLAVVIKGRTRHFDQVVAETARGIRELSQRSRVPVILGIIAADRVADAVNRTGIKHMNKGREWALAAIETANLLKKIGGQFRAKTETPLLQNNPAMIVIFMNIVQGPCPLIKINTERHLWLDHDRNTGIL